MKRSDLITFIEGEFAKIQKINSAKGHDYAGDEDALDNFKRGAKRLGVTPEQIWAVYAFKHIDALETYVKEGEVQSEPIEGRLHDIILYCFLLLALKDEQKNGDLATAKAIAAQARSGGRLAYPQPTPGSIPHAVATLNEGLGPEKRIVNHLGVEDGGSSDYGQTSA